ncbi:MAG: molybdate ABC transporter substrate-binding protein [Desulfoplanes sp.]|nr:molybdate ABC transporter substrate-binding protein [Desulfoplanes sp.]
MYRILCSTLVLLFLFSAPVYSGQEIIISAAASLTDAFTDIKPAFEATHPGTEVIMNFASSGACFRQIEQGAPADIFASANPKWMAKAVQAKLVTPESETVFAHNSLVLAVPAANPVGITTLNDLGSDKVTKIGVGTPKTVPAGKYAQQALESLGLWSTFESKYIFAASVRQVLDYLRRGEIDCGFVYATDAKKGGNAVRTVQEIALEKPVTYPIGVLATSENKVMAMEFIHFLTSEQGQNILTARGFSKK